MRFLSTIKFYDVKEQNTTNTDVQNLSEIPNISYTLKTKHPIKCLFHQFKIFFMFFHQHL